VSQAHFAVLLRPLVVIIFVINQYAYCAIKRTSALLKECITEAVKTSDVTVQYAAGISHIYVFSHFAKSPQCCACLTFIPTAVHLKTR